MPKGTNLNLRALVRVMTRIGQPARQEDKRSRGMALCSGSSCPFSRLPADQLVAHSTAQASRALVLIFFFPSTRPC
jgi:hypothetical protein